MSKKISIIGYWGYIPAKIAKKGINILDKQMQKNDNKIDEIDNETERDQDIINELAQKTDKESRRQWKSEYGKNINTVKRLEKSNDILDGIRVAGEKIIYKPVNQLVAKRIRTEKEIANLQNTKKQIEDRQEEIKQEMLKTNRIEVKDDLKKELTKSQNKLNKITKQISKLNIKLSKILQKIAKMQEIIDDEFDMEEEYNMQIEETQQGKENLKEEASSEKEMLKENPQKESGKKVAVRAVANDSPEKESGKKVAVRAVAKDSPEKEDAEKEVAVSSVEKDSPEKEDAEKEVAVRSVTKENSEKKDAEKATVDKNSEKENTDEEKQVKKESIFQKIKTVGKNIATKVSGTIKYVGRKIKNVWNKFASKVNLEFSNINNAMLESAKKSEEKLAKNIQTFEEKRKNLLNELNVENEVKIPDEFDSKTEERTTTVDKEKDD